jgi:hypothetical protein
MIYRAVIGFALGVVTHEVASRVRKAHSPLDRQRDLWGKVNHFLDMLSEEDLGLFRSLKVRLDSDLALHPHHELRLKEMHQDLQERLVQ